MENSCRLRFHRFAQVLFPLLDKKLDKAFSSFTNKSSPISFESDQAFLPRPHSRGESDRNSLTLSNSSSSAPGSRTSTSVIKSTLVSNFISTPSNSTQSTQISD